MNPNQALWEMGDFTRIAASMRESGDDGATGGAAWDGRVGHCKRIMNRK